MKKILLLCTAALTLLTCSVYAGASADVPVTVGLYYGNTAAESVNITADEGFYYGTYHKEFTQQGELSELSLSITANDNNIILNETTNFLNEICIFPKSGFLSINSAEYRGGVVLRANSSKLTVINCLDIEEYLYGVIGSEMPSSWDIEALKAQAVCARSFAYTNLNKHSSEGFNLCPTTNCQVYTGINAETQATIKAVDETAGELLMYDGAVAQTVFFSSSGGHTADVRNIWGGDIPYLYGVEDLYENPETTPRHSWSASVSAEDIREALENIEVDIGEITNVEATADATGHVYELKLTGTEGSHTLKRLSTCSVLSAYGLLNTKYTVTPYGADTKKLYAVSAEKNSVVDNIYIISSTSKISEAGMPITILSSSGKTTLKAGTPTGYIFNGGGWGHGVGMSQYGAKGMAENGFTYDEILYHYYPGTNLKEQNIENK